MSAAKKILSLAVSATVLFAMTVFLTSPARYAESVRAGVSLWAVGVLPAMFPFLFFTALLTALSPYAFFSRKLAPVTGKIFRISGAGGGAAILSALSGYPVGARMVCDLFEAKLVSRNEAFRLSCLCSTSGPTFLVGTVGCLMFRNTAAGWLMLLSHLGAIWLVCFFLRFTAKPFRDRLPAVKPASRNVLSDSLWGAIVSVLCVGGLIALFYCFGQMLSDLGVFSALSALFGGSPYAEGVCRGLLEMTTGCAFLSSFQTPLAVALSAATVTFGGTCVLCQQAAYLTRADVKILPFLAVKLLQAALAFAICYPLAFALC